MNNKTPIIYLLGAGRSGTTLIATILNDHPRIVTIGEMHQFVEHLIENKPCSCGKQLTKCQHWKPVVDQLSFKESDLKKIQRNIETSESHKRITKLLIRNSGNTEYIDAQNEIYEKIHLENPGKIFLDSSKYIARFLLLKRSKKLDLKGIYVVRDVRGVINSFSKQVQTTKGPLATILYYYLINLFGQLVSWLQKDVIKIKYEDFINNPIRSINQIYEHVFIDEESISKLPDEYVMPHIIGGNRMKSNKKISIRKDLNWKIKISRSKQIAYYVLSLPFMLLNRYKP